jgi:hypothetical protein
MKVFTDPITGKKFQLGSRGVDALNERVSTYVEERKQAGVNEVTLAPSKMETGAAYRCSSCNQDFVFGGEDQEAFINGIKEHGRSHGVCQILPVL